MNGSSDRGSIPLSSMRKALKNKAFSYIRNQKVIKKVIRTNVLTKST